VPTAGVARSSPRPSTDAVTRRFRAEVKRQFPGPDSVWWLALVAAAFIAVELAFVVERAGLKFDETLYVSQVSSHAPAAFFDPARSRGITILVAPVTLLTSSVMVLRVYLSVASGVALFGALLVWRRLRPAWELALAGLLFGGLWVVQFYGPRVMPDFWLALSALAAVGFFLRAAARLAAGGLEERDRAWGPLAGLAACLAFAALMRVGDAVFLALPLVGAVLVVRAWRRWQLAAAVVTGLVAGGLEWVIEAYARFGGVLARLHAASAEQGGFGLHLGVLADWRGLDGPVQCRPCSAPLQQPLLGVWWLALPVLVTLGLLAARRADRLRSGALAALCGLSLGAQYLLLIDYGNPRFLIPMYALLAVPVADALAWFLTGVPAVLRPAAVALTVACIMLQLISQHGVLAEWANAPTPNPRDAAMLHRFGVDPPCLILGVKQRIPIAYYAGCASVGNLVHVGPGVHVAVLEYGKARGPAYVDGWPRRRVANNMYVYYRP
jgi:hypothetical protein